VNTLQDKDNQSAQMDNLPKLRLPKGLKEKSLMIFL